MNVSVRLCGKNVRSPYKLCDTNCNCTLDTPIMFILVYQRPAGRTEIYSFRFETRNGRQKFSSHFVRFETVVAMIMNINVYWDGTPCSLLDKYWPFGWIYCLHLQEENSSERSEREYPCFLRSYTLWTGRSVHSINR